MVLTIFMWTPAHFWSLTLSKRKDYGKAGIPMLNVVKGEDTTRNHIVGYSVILVITSLLIFIFGETGAIFLISGTVLSLYFSYLAFNLKQNKSEEYAWRVFQFSNVYLYAIFIFLVIDAKYQLNLF